VNAVELLMPDGKPSGVKACGACRLVYGERHAAFGITAESCCTEAKCDRCGAGLGCTVNRRSYTFCDQCRRNHEAEREAARFAKATKLTPGEFAASEAGGWMLYSNSADRWFVDLDEADDHFSDYEEPERPAYLWCSRPVNMVPDFAGHIGDMLAGEYDDDAYDRIPKEAIEELNDFERQWWAKYGPTSYQLDYSRCVVLDPDRIPGGQAVAEGGGG
jgi:hypothetical protein